MSRSRRKHPVYKWKDKKGKRAASRAFRHFKGEVPVRSKQFFRRIFNSWDVWDNWWYDFDNDKDRKEFRGILRELQQNAIDKHLSEEEAYILLDKLKELKYCFMNSK